MAVVNPSTAVSSGHPPVGATLAVALPKTFLRFQSDWTGGQPLWPPNAEPWNPPSDLTVPPGSDKVLTKADIWTQRQYSSPSGLAHDDELPHIYTSHVRFLDQPTQQKHKEEPKDDQSQ